MLTLFDETRETVENRINGVYEDERSTAKNIYLYSELFDLKQTISAFKELINACV